MTIIGKEDQAEIRRLFASNLTADVRIMLFASKKMDRNSLQTLQLLEEVAKQSDKVKLEILTLEEEPARVAELKIDAAPTTVVVGSNGGKLYYLGTPGGQQLKSLVEDIIDASRGRAEMAQAVRSTIGRVKNEVLIEVFVTLFCAYSPNVVRAAHRFALENPKIRAVMIDTAEFPELAQKYGVLGAPTTVINASVRFEGAPGDETFATKILEAPP